MNKSLLTLAAITVTSLLLSSCNNTTTQFESLLVDETYTSEKVIEKFHPTEEQQHGLELYVSFKYPTTCSNEEFLPTLQKSFVNLFFGPDYESLEPKAAFDKYVQDAKDEYESSIESNINDYDEMYGGLFSHAIHIQDSIMFQNDQLIQVFINCFDYFGGAHGSIGYAAALFDIKNETKLTAKDVFVDDMDPVRDMLFEEYSKDLEGIEIDLSEIKNNFWNDDTIWAITPDGIIFSYSSYMLGFYALGSPSIFLPYSQIASFIREDSPVYPICQASLAEKK